MSKLNALIFKRPSADAQSLLGKEYEKVTADLQKQLARLIDKYENEEAKMVLQTK
jgi:hypothetical protein